MKKIIATFFALFIILTMALPVFAVECEEHIVNYPATPAYTHEVGIDIYLCDLCGYEMWHCEECDQYMPIHEVSCRNCKHVRVAINSQEQAKINQDIKNEQYVKNFLKGFWIFAAAVLVIVIGVAAHNSIW